MSVLRFDLGLSERDQRAIRAARRERLVVDREAALRLIREASALVDGAVRRRPLLSGPAFTLPGHEENSSLP